MLPELFCLTIHPTGMKKFCYITYYWPPSGGAGVQRSLKIYQVPSWIRYWTDSTDGECWEGKVIHYWILLWEESLPNLRVIRTYSFEALQVMSVMGKSSRFHMGICQSRKRNFLQKVLWLRGNFFHSGCKKRMGRTMRWKPRKNIIAERGDTIVIWASRDYN